MNNHQSKVTIYKCLSSLRSRFSRIVRMIERSEVDVALEELILVERTLKILLDLTAEIKSRLQARDV